MRIWGAATVSPGHIGSRRRPRHPLMVSAAIASALSMSLAMPQAAAALTAEEIEQEIADAEAQVDARAEDASRKQDALSSTMRAIYKSGATGVSAAWGVFLAPGVTIERLVSLSQYASSLASSQAHAVDEARAAVASLAEERDGLVALREELQARVEAKENRDSGEYHFFQRDARWSLLPYWGGYGTVGADGCGLCSYTTMVNLLCGTSYTPDEMLRLRGDWAGLEENLDYVNGTPDGSTHAEWTKAHFDIDQTTLPVTVRAAREALQDDETILIVGPVDVDLHDRYGSWRHSGGHYMCVYRCDDGGFYLHDSAYEGEAGTAVYYTDAEFEAMLARTPVLLCNRN